MFAVGGGVTLRKLRTDESCVGSGEAQSGQMEESEGSGEGLHGRQARNFLLMCEKSASHSL